MPLAIAICNTGGGSGISIYIRPTALCRICNVTSRNLSLTGAPHVTIYYIRAVHVTRAAGYRHRLGRKYSGVPLVLTHAAVCRWERMYRPLSAPYLLWADMPP